LRGALSSWTHLDAPYQQALTRLMLGLACREMGDEEGAVTEISSARAALVALGATSDVTRVDRLTSAPTRGRVDGLTGREVELLGLLATGKTNRDIAAALFISEKTVARHVSNIFNKLGVSSRAAATAYAYQHDLA
jgi:DNA-binding NarL/FixJ family response regulator